MDNVELKGAVWYGIPNLKEVQEKLVKLKKLNGRNRVGLFVDAPNMNNGIYKVDLKEIVEAVKARGHLVIGKVFVNIQAPPTFLQAIFTLGLRPVISNKDVDVMLAVEATRAILEDKIDVLVLATGDGDFAPLFHLARNYDKQSILVTIKDICSSALISVADHIIYLHEKEGVKI